MTLKLHVFPLSPRAFKVLAVANHLGQRSTIGGNQRNSCRHRLEGGQSEALVERRKDQGSRPCEQIFPPFVRDIANVLDVARERRLRRARQPFAGVSGRTSSQYELRRRSRLRKSRQRIEDHADILARFERTEQQDISVRR